MTPERPWRCAACRAVEPSPIFYDGWCLCERCLGRFLRQRRADQCVPDWLLTLRRVAAVVLVGLVLAGCARFRPEPLHIQFPVPPKLVWAQCQPDEDGTPRLCLSERDAAALAKWIDRVRAFEAARERLLRD